MAWVNLSTLLTHLRQRKINPREITVFIDDHLVDPRFQHPPARDLTSEETEDMYDDDTEVD